MSEIKRNGLVGMDGLSRREFMAALSGLALPLIVGCGSESSTAERSTLVVGLCDALAKPTASECVGEYAQREYAGLAACVKSETGIGLRFRNFRFDELLIEAARAGEVEALIAKTWTVLRASRAAPGRFQRLADIPGPTGAHLLRGAFIVRADSPLDTLNDLHQKSIALGSNLNYESSFQARKVLAQLGVSPGESIALDSCLSAAALVWEKTVDVAVVSDYCADHSALQLVGDAKAFRLLARTPGIPFVTFAVSETAPHTLRSRLAQCLLKLSGSEVPEDLHTTGLIAPIMWKPEELEVA